jgi:cardiolipin synthase
MARMNLVIIGILVPLLHLTGILFAGHAALFARTSQGAIAWALSLIFFPYLSVPLYLVFGRKKFHGYVEARRRGDRRIDHVADSLLHALRPFRATLCGDSARVNALQHLTLLPFTGGNSADLLIDGQATFDALFAAIDAAQRYLLIQFFIVRDDGLGRALRDRLIARAAAGVRVYFLYDEIGSIRLPASYWAGLRQAGVAVHPFNTRRGWRNRFQINFRNHRKIVVADGRDAFVGGHNVGDEYLGKSARFGAWRDTHIHLRGPAVATVQWSFVEDWNWATGAVLELKPLPPPNSPPDSHPASGPASSPAPDSPTALTASPAPAPPSASSDCGGAAAIVIPSGPADNINTCTLMFLSLIGSARSRLWITSPYFVPNETVFDALQLAALRGVDVRIMLPAKPDHVLVYLSSFSFLEEAGTAGVKFYRYRAGFLHQKVLLLDDDVAAVGTANLDNRSMRLNFELTVLLADRPFAAAVEAMLLQDFARCDRATQGDLKRRGLLFRVAVRIAGLTAPIQ